MSSYEDFPVGHRRIGSCDALMRLYLEQWSRWAMEARPRCGPWRTTTKAVWEMEEEETVVLAFQVYLNGGPAGEGVRRLTDAGLDLESLRAEALALLRE